jgi:hypothetical protein
MTVTAINQQPATYSPAYNENIYLASSSATAQQNFRFVFDVYGSDGTTLIARVKLPARPSDSKGLFDAKRIVENYLSHDVPDAQENAGFYRNSNSYCKYTVKVGEEYNAGSSLTSFYAQQTLQAKYVWNAALDWLEFMGFAYADYMLTTGGMGGNFLSAAPGIQKIETNQNAWLSMITASSGSIRTGLFTKYNPAGVSLGTLTITNSYDPITDDADRFLRLACGTTNIEAHTPGWIDSSVGYYTVQVLDSVLGEVSDVMRYDITENCRFTTVRLHWLNHLGGWDSFNFTMKSYERISAMKRVYKKHYGTTSGNWDYSSNERGDVVFDSSGKQIFSINSGWLSETESAWLEGLLLSPEVYQEVDSNMLIAVVIKTDEYEKKKKENEKLFQLKLEFAYSSDKIRQRG